MKLQKHYKGCYRVNMTDTVFGQTTKVGNEWHAEVRKSRTGEIVRYAGIWNSRKESIDELLSYNPVDFISYG